jgi:hypothetical protein
MSGKTRKRTQTPQVSAKKAKATVVEKQQHTKAKQNDQGEGTTKPMRKERKFEFPLGDTPEVEPLATINPKSYTFRKLKKGLKSKPLSTDAAGTRIFYPLLLLLFTA